MIAPRFTGRRLPRRAGPLGKRAAALGPSGSTHLMRKGTDHVETRSGLEAMTKLGELVRGRPFAMVTTADGAGRLVSRPLTTQDVEFDGRLWFFVGASSEWV